MGNRISYLGKVTRPVLADALQRKRLFKILDEKLQRPLLWISGPPGSGKTILISTYIESRNLPHIWYQMDVEDSDPATFFYYTAQALKKAYPKKRQSLPIYTQEYQIGGLRPFSRLYFDEFFKKVKKPFLLVLDNFQEINQETTQINTILKEAINCIPDGINIVVISREDLPGDLLSLKLQANVSTLYWEDLKVSPEESETIIKRRKSLSEETIKYIQQKASGWMAGLVLLLETIEDTGKMDLTLQGHSQDEIFTYFASEVFERVSSDIKEFLLSSALLPRMTSQMAETLTGQPKASEILSTLYLKNYFTYRRPGPETTYEYHPLFREFLLTYASRRFSKEKLLQLKQKAATLLDNSGEPEEAARLYIETGQWQRLSQLILNNAEAFISQGRNKLLEQWIRTLPEEVFFRNTWLIYWLGLCKLPFEPPESLRYFDLTYEQFKAQTDTTGMFLSCFGAVDAILYVQANFNLLDKWIQILEEFLSSDVKFPSPEMHARAIACMFSSLVIRRPYPPEIQQWGNQVLTMSRYIEDPNLRIYSEVDVSFYYQWTGRFIEAEEILAPLRNLVRHRKVSPLAFTTLKAFEAMYFSLRGMHKECLSAVSEGLRVVEETGSTTMLYQLLTHGAAGYLGAGEYKKAEQFLEQAEKCTHNSQIMNVAYYHYLKAWSAINNKNIISAQEHIALAIDLVSRLGFPFMEAMLRLGAVQVFHDAGNSLEAIKHLNTALKIGRKMKSYMIEFMCNLFRAQIRFAEGNSKKGYIYLSKALKIGKKQGYSYFLFWRPEVFANLCAKALKASIEPEYVCEVIKLRGLAPETPPLEIPQWPWPVRIYTLGKFILEIRGQTLTFIKKAQQKPLALLKALIASGGKGVSTLKLIDILWPDTPGDMAFSSFTTTVQRLRNLLGSKETIQVTEGKVTLNPTCCWVDVWALERMLYETERILTENPSREKEIANLTCKTIQMYKGPFLEEETEHYWTVQMREKLRSRFLRHILLVGEYFQKNSKFKKAIEVYNRGLEIEPLAEEIYQQLMRCYSKLGYRAQVKKTYNKCAYMLSEVLGVDPSPETTELYNQFIK